MPYTVYLIEAGVRHGNIVIVPVEKPAGIGIGG
jgi:hypothetical protein